jgi:hypothetical protein
MKPRASSVLTLAGQILAFAAAAAVIVLWLILLRRPNTPGPTLAWVAFGSIIAAVAAALGALFKQPLLTAIVSAFLLPWGIYFLWTNTVFQWIGYASFGLGAAAVLLLAGRVAEAVRG